MSKNPITSTPSLLLLTTRRLTYYILILPALFGILVVQFHLLMNSSLPAHITRTNRAITTTVVATATSSPSIIVDDESIISTFLLPATTTGTTTTTTSTTTSISKYDDNGTTTLIIKNSNNNNNVIIKKKQEPKRNTTTIRTNNKKIGIPRNVSTEKKVTATTGKLFKNFLTTKNTRNNDSTTTVSKTSFQTSSTTTTKSNNNYNTISNNNPTVSQSNIIIHNNTKQQLLYNNNNNNRPNQQQQVRSSSTKEEQVVVPKTIATRKDVTTIPQSSSLITNDENDRIHIVFSTGCSESQDWQSYLFFYSIWKSKQKGNVTRIVSGCTKQQQQTMERDFQTTILNSIPTATDRFFLYFTPDYSNIHLSYRPKDTVKNYKFFNKPFALKNWMENKLGYNHTKQQQPKEVSSSSMDNTVIIILDPDQLVLKPLIVDYTKDLTMKWHGQNQDWLLSKPIKRRWRRATAPIMKIRKGRPFSQLYGLGTNWVSKIVQSMNTTIMETTSGIIKPQNPFNTKINASIPNNTRWTIKNKSFYINRTNGLQSIKENEFYFYYNAGPPYIGIASDMYNIVTVWSDIVVPVYYESNRAHLAEMYAYCIASAYLGLRHQLAISYMISHPQISPDHEKWDNDTLVLQNDTYYMDWSDPTHHYNTEDVTKERGHFVPYLFHYCQEYSLGPYNFFKYFIPKTILSCNQPMLLEPPSLLKVADPKKPKKVTSTNIDRRECGSIAYQYNTSYSLLKRGNQNITNLLHKKHNAYALCQLIYRLNDAIMFWKNNHCDNTRANYEKIWTIPPLTTAATIAVS